MSGQVSQFMITHLSLPGRLAQEITLNSEYINGSRGYQTQHIKHSITTTLTSMLSVLSCRENPFSEISIIQGFFSVTLKAFLSFCICHIHTHHVIEHYKQYLCNSISQSSTTPMSFYLNTPQQPVHNKCVF